MNTTLRRILMLSLLAGFCLLDACKSSDPAPAAPTPFSATTILGDWKITAAAGTEWKQGFGISTPKADDPGKVGITINFFESLCTVKQNGVVIYQSSYTPDAAASTVLIGPNGNTGLGLFKINDFVATSGMKMDQREPITDDYTFNANCNCKLYFQKNWTLVKQ